MNPGVLTGADIGSLLAETPPLLLGRDLSTRIQSAGIDLSVERIWRFLGPGSLPSAGRGTLAEREVVELGSSELYRLEHGTYVIRLNERMTIPTKLMGLVLPRSTLLRNGCTLHGAVFDPGYEGTPEVLLSVLNPHGFLVAKNAAICQFVLLTLTSDAVPYSGRYQEADRT